MTDRYSTLFPSVQQQVSAAEWETRVNLAACYRLIDRYGMSDLIYNHITARIPGSDDHLLINLYGLLYKEITASSLVKIDAYACRHGGVVGEKRPLADDADLDAFCRSPGLSRLRRPGD